MERIDVSLTWDEIGMLKAGLAARKEDLRVYLGGSWNDRATQLVDEADSLFIRLSEQQARIRHPAGKAVNG